MVGYVTSVDFMLVVFGLRLFCCLTVLREFVMILFALVLGSSVNLIGLLLEY